MRGSTENKSRQSYIVAPRIPRNIPNIKSSRRNYFMRGIKKLAYKRRKRRRRKFLKIDELLEIRIGWVLLKLSPRKVDVIFTAYLLLEIFIYSPPYFFSQSARETFFVASFFVISCVGWPFFSHFYTLNFTLQETNIKGAFFLRISSYFLRFPRRII